MKYTIKRKGRLSLKMKNTFYVKNNEELLFIIKQDGGSFSDPITYELFAPEGELLLNMKEVEVEKKGFDYVFLITDSKTQEVGGTIMRSNEKSGPSIVDVLKDKVGGGIANTLTGTFNGLSHGKTLGWGMLVKDRKKKKDDIWIYPSKVGLKDAAINFFANKLNIKHDIEVDNEIIATSKSTMNFIKCKTVIDLPDDLADGSLMGTLLLLTIVVSIESRKE